MNNKSKIIYWVFTVLLSAMMLLQAYNFIFNTEMISNIFQDLGYSTSLILPLGIAKVLAVVAITSNLSQMLKKLAYLGLGIDFVAALVSHLITGVGSWTGATIAIVLLFGSYIFYRKTSNSQV